MKKNKFKKVREQASRLFPLKSVKKKYTKDSHHSIDPKETVARATKALKKVGKMAFDELEEVGHLDPMGLPVYRVTCGKRFNEWGKGLTPEQSQASALMERVERYSSVPEFRPKINLKRARFVDLPKGKAISRWEFGPCNIHRAFLGKQRVNETEMDWAPVISLIDGQEYLVPAQEVYFRYPSKGFKDYLCTTGLAAGNTIEEAIIEALSEVIERHVLHIMLFNQSLVKQIDLNSVKNKELKKLIKKLKEKGFTIVANDFSEGWGLSSVSAFVFHPQEISSSKQNAHSCCGTSPDPEIALMRALTEVAQGRSVNFYKHSLIRDKKGVFKSAQEEYKWRTKDPTPISIKDLSNLAKDDFKEEIKVAVAKVAERGYNVLVSDLTHPQLNIPVVRVIVPGLQPNFDLLGMNILDKRSAVTQHLKQYPEIVNSCKKRQFCNQKIDEVFSL